jgi:hypothetical protein
MTSRTLISPVIVLFSSFAVWAIEPSSTDLWDVSRGTSIIRHSAVDNCSGDPSAPFDVRKVFGGGALDCPAEVGSIVFSDLAGPGFVNFIEWRTQQPVTLRSFNLWASGDGASDRREMGQFRLKTKSPGSSVFDIVIHSFTPTRPYTYVGETYGLLVSTDVRPTVGQEFRAEFTNPDPVLWAPRVKELDGFDTFIGPKLEIRVSEVELAWPTVEGVRYQVEVLEPTPGANWQTYGAAILGTGSRIVLREPIPADAGSRLFRIRPLD